jgi:hypothetical protein
VFALESQKQITSHAWKQIFLLEIDFYWNLYALHNKKCLRLVMFSDIGGDEECSDDFKTPRLISCYSSISIDFDAA